MKVFNNIIALIIAMLQMITPQSLIETHFKTVLSAIASKQEENFQFYDKTDGRDALYAYYEFDNDGLKDLFFVTAVSGMNLLEINIYVMFGNGEHTVITNDFFMTKGLDNLESLEEYSDKDGNKLYLIKSDVFSSGEQRNSERFFDSGFIKVKEFTTIECNDQYRYFTDYYNGKDITAVEYNSIRDNYYKNITKIDNIELNSITDFHADSIDSFVNQLFN
ncbi:MAG: hypothetical protein LBM41_01430 [Ruminococcus sp.]|nr:hypothetical protein [Ruminococcus sp.]